MDLSSQLSEIMGTKKGMRLRAELAKTRFRKTFLQLLAEEEQVSINFIYYKNIVTGNTKIQLLIFSAILER